jgi:hypothetical protein
MPRNRAKPNPRAERSQSPRRTKPIPRAERSQCRLGGSEARRLVALASAFRAFAPASQAIPRNVSERFLVLERAANSSKRTQSGPETRDEFSKTNPISHDRRSSTASFLSIEITKNRKKYREKSLDTWLMGLCQGTQVIAPSEPNRRLDPNPGPVAESIILRAWRLDDNPGRGSAIRVVPSRTLPASRWNRPARDCGTGLAANPQGPL